MNKKVYKFQYSIKPICFFLIINPDNLAADIVNLTVSDLYQKLVTENIIFNFS